MEIAWWRERRFRAERITKELRAAYRVLSVTPHIGGATNAKDVRYLSLSRIGYHLFFRIDEASGQVLIRGFRPMGTGHEPYLM